MIKRAAMLLGLWMGAALLAAPAAADGPVPRSYPEGTNTRARPDRPAADMAREQAMATNHDAACNAGMMAGCSDLGLAYERGEGRPQNRPVAELLYRQACNAADQAGCLRLGELLGTTRDEADQREAAAMFIRACQLGSWDGCEAQAADLAAGMPGERDLQAAEALRRATCAAGGTTSCRTLAGMLMERERSLAEREEGQALIDRQCRAGDPAACRDAVFHWRGAEDESGPRTMEYHALGCSAGEAWSCSELGEAELAKGPQFRDAALVFYDRACTLGSDGCADAERLRAEPLLAARCDSGDQAACVTLGQMLAQAGGALKDRDRALALLGPACEAGRDDACLPAAYLVYGQWQASGVPQPERAAAYLAQSCAAETREACELLADELASGERLPPDTARAGQLYVAQCEDGRDRACEFLDQQAVNDPASPLRLARADFGPELTHEEAAEEQRQFEERRRAEREAARAQNCTTTTAEYLGQSYTDTLCDSIQRVIRGFAVKRGTAPWQALLWRPQELNNTRLTDDQRVLCGGAVIREGWILTAAHCLTDEKGVSILTGGHRIRLGLSNPMSDEGFTFPIIAAVPHPDYDRKTFAFDIAVVRYDPRAGQRGSEVLPIARIRLDPQPLASRPISAGTPVYTYGWGRTALAGGERPDVLRGARLELRDGAACTQITRFRDHRLDSVLCAAGPKGEQACFGDSGGPLITYGDAGGLPTVIGVVSAGVKCGTTGVPSRYTRVAKVRDWLDRVLTPRRAR